MSLVLFMNTIPINITLNKTLKLRKLLVDAITLFSAVKMAIFTPLGEEITASSAMETLKIKRCQDKSQISRISHLKLKNLNKMIRTIFHNKIRK